MGRASSTKKVQRAAKAGGRARARRQQGLVFPVALGLVVLLGLALVVYARQSRDRAAANTPPTLSDHWHAAYAFYTCDTFQPALRFGSSADDPDPLGVHTHGDGVIHIHPFTSEATGKNAKLERFFRTVGVEMSDDKLELPENQGTYRNGDDCNGKEGRLRAAVWSDAGSTGAPDIYVADFDNIRFTNDGMAITIAFVPDDVDLSTLKPPTAENLAELGAVDATGVPGLDQSINPGATTTTVPGDTSTTVPAEGSTPSSSVADPAATSSTSQG